MLKSLFLKRDEDRRIRSGHPWVFSNEVDVMRSPLKSFDAGECVNVVNARDEILACAYINPQTLLAARVYAYKSHNTLFDRTLIKARLIRALNLRSTYFSKPFYRLCFAEGDYLPGIVIDRFNDTFVVQLNTQGAWRVKSELTEALIELFQPRGILLKNDQSSLALEGLTPCIEILHGQVDDEVLIEENDVSFYTPIHQGQKTGWFFDQRYNRAYLQHFVKDKTVLDVFAYLGSFGICAGAYGAKSVSFIETSKFSCDYIAKNLAKNNLSAKSEIINEDAFVALKALKDAGRKFDVVMIDPPAFIKRKKDAKEGFLAYQRINELALACLSDNGILVSSSCSMHLSSDDLRDAIIKANKGRFYLSTLNLNFQGPDHPWLPCVPETLYLKTFFIQKSIL